jgi:hypothetical protein
MCSRAESWVGSAKVERKRLKNGRDLPKLPEMITETLSSLIIGRKNLSFPGHRSHSIC